MFHAMSPVWLSRESLAGLDMGAENLSAFILSAMIAAQVAETALPKGPCPGLKQMLPWDLDKPIISLF